MKAKQIKETFFYAPFDDFNKVKIAWRDRDCPCPIRLIVHLYNGAEDSLGMFGHYCYSNDAMIEILLTIKKRFNLEIEKLDIVQPEIEGEARMTIILTNLSPSDLTPEKIDEFLSYFNEREIVKGITAYIKDPYLKNYLGYKK